MKKIPNKKKKMPNGKKGLSLAMSLFMSTSAVLVNPNVRIVNAAGVMKTSSNGVGGIEVHYANNGANPNNLPYGKDVKVEDVVNIKVTFPADYGTMNKKVTINYEFNPAQKISWGGRPFYWFSLPRGVDEPSKITLYNKGKEKKNLLLGTNG